MKNFDKLHLEPLGWEYIDDKNYKFDILKNKEGFYMNILNETTAVLSEYFKDADEDEKIFLVGNIYVSDIPWLDRLMRRLLISNVDGNNFRIQKNSFVNDFAWVLQKIPLHVHNSVSDYYNYRLLKHYNFYREKENTISIIEYTDNLRTKYKTLFFGVIETEEEFTRLLKQLKIKK